jgi:hypothetical protein
MPWASGVNAMDPMPSSFSVSFRPVALHPAIEHVVGRLMDQARRAEILQDLHRLARPLRIVGGNARIERLARPHDLVERTHRFFQRRVGIEAVRIENVDIVEPHPLQRLVAGRDQVFPAAPLAIRPRPHHIAGLGRDDQLIPVSLQIGAKNFAERLLRAAGRRTVIVGEIEMGNAVVEGGLNNRPLGLMRRIVAEIMPQAERDRRQIQTGASAAAVDHLLVAVFGGHIDHQLPFLSSLAKRLLAALPTG